jgi:hypothetical protein
VRIAKGLGNKPVSNTPGCFHFRVTGWLSSDESRSVSLSYMENVQGLKNKTQERASVRFTVANLLPFFELGPTPIVILDDAEAQLADSIKTPS